MANDANSGKNEGMSANLDDVLNFRGAFGLFMAERDRRLEERFQAQEKALEKQATEYQRRLHDLNGEYKRDRERQTDYVRVDKYEDNLKLVEARIKSEIEARDLALQRVDEKFDEYVKRYEARQREVDLLLTAQKAAAEAAKQAAEDEGRRAREATNVQARKTNRNIALMGLALAALVAFSNWIPAVIN